MSKSFALQNTVAGRHQKGMSVTAILLVVTIAAFLALFAFKVVPAHLEFLTVKSIGQTISDNDELMKQPKSKVMVALQKSFRANSLWELKPEESFIVSKDAKRGGNRVEVNYERRSTLFMNIDVVSRFQHDYSEDDGS